MQQETALFSIKQLTAMLKARAGFMLKVTVVFVLLTLVVTLITPKVWTAHSDIYVDYRENDPISGRGISAMLDDSYIQTQIDLLKSQRVINGVIQALDLTSTPAYQDALKADSRQRAEAALIQTIQNNIVITRDRNSRVISVAYNGSTPAQARSFSNAVVAAYIDLHNSIESSATRHQMEQYRVELEQMRQDVDTAQTRLTDYQQSSGILNTQDHGDLETRKLTELTASLTLLKERAEEARARNDEIDRLLASGVRPEELPQISQLSAIYELKGQRAIIDQRLAEVRGSLGVNHPTIKGLNQERQNIAGRLGREADAGLKAERSNLGRLTQQIEGTEKEIESQRARVLQQLQQQDDISSLQRQLASAQQIYSGALQKYDGLVMASKVSSPGVTVLREAELPTRPSKPKKTMNMLLGLVVGGFFALFFGLLLELVTRRVRCVEDIATEGGVPVLGTIRI